MSKPAIFLDRDGVIIENRADYVRRWQDVEFLPSARAALVQANRSHLMVVLVTNQSAVGRGLVSLDQVVEINDSIVEEIASWGGRIDATYLCPHHPEAHCACRKPEPGMLIKASSDLGIDLARSVVVGDAASDIRAGLRVGAHGILVLTGRGCEQMHELTEPEHAETTIVPDLGAAINHILELGNHDHQSNSASHQFLWRRDRLSGLL